MRLARARASDFWAGLARVPESVTTPCRAMISMRWPERTRLDRSVPATASAVIWLELGATPWADAAVAIKATRPNAVEIRFSPNIMGRSFSRGDIRRDPRPNGERDASFGSENRPIW